MWFVAVMACSGPQAPLDPEPDGAEDVVDAAATAAAPAAVVVPPGALFAEGIVATADLPPGHVIEARDLLLGTVPNFAPAPPTDVQALIGATVEEPIFGGEPVRLERLVLPTEGGPQGYDALVGPGERAVALAVPGFATTGLEPGCPVEVLAVGDPGRRPRVLGGAHHVVLGVDPGSVAGEATVVVRARTGRAPDATTAATIVALPLATVMPPPENQGPTTFEAPTDRPGPPIAVAQRYLLPGVMIRSDDLAEVGGAGLEGLRYAVAWAQVVTQPIYPGELPHPLRLAAPGRGLCAAIPDGMASVAVPAAGGVGPELVDGHVRVRVGDNVIDHLYVGVVDPIGNTVVVFTSRESARALAVAAAAVGARFEVTPSPL